MIYVKAKLVNIYKKSDFTDSFTQITKKGSHYLQCLSNNSLSGRSELFDIKVSDEIAASKKIGELVDIPVNISVYKENFYLSAVE